ncbi:MAG: hypothetical protein HY052_04905 [Proteobacteria bacterium]|nr:hypothetical protein [Pseudomonadota bacterium]
MRLTAKNKLCFWMVTLLATALTLFQIASAGAADPSVPVNVANHENFTRIVFEFPKLLAYHVKVTGGTVNIDFDTKSATALSSVKSPLVKEIREIPNNDGVMRVDIALIDGATIKHYRLQRKVVVDVYPSGAMPKAALEKPKEVKPTTQVTEKKAPLAAPPPMPEKTKTTGANAPILAAKTKNEAPVATAAVPKTAEPAQAPQEVTAAQLKAAIANPDSLAAAKISPTAPTAAKAMTAIADLKDEQEETTPEEINKITLSFLAPTRLAVFERSDALWIITDSTVRTTLPVITGPMAAFISPPKTMRFDGGTAYRYTFPQKFHPDIKKRNLSWDISLLTAPPQPIPPVDIKSSFDQVSRKARLMVSMKGGGAAITLEDPLVGDTLYVVPASQPAQAVQNSLSLTDFDIVPAALGLIIRPLKDGLKIYPANDLILLTAADGLTITPEGVGTPVLIGETDTASDNDNNRLFDFPNWRQGGARQLQENRQKLQDAIVSAKTPDERAGLLMKLATLYFANHFGQEALGMLEMVQTENPEMEKNPEFIAIRGAANAMSGNYKEALQDLSYPAIQQNPEVNLWIGYAAAATEQWHMADRSFPKSNRLLLQYPDNIAIPFTIYMAESTLHLGHTDTAKKLLDTVNMTSDAMDPQYQAAIDYLRGETFAQDGKLDKAEELWRPVMKGLDRLYHTKASLSLTRILLQQKKISLKDAIEQIDNLRFAWRGDGLEVQVLSTLGALKVQNNQVLSGLEDMKQAADLSDGILDDSSHIRDEMKRIFSGLFVGDEASKIPPLEAVSVYNEFSTLLPSGPEGTMATLDFANYLIHIDLLDKAASIIEDQIKAGLPEEKMMSAGTKLAAVYLLDKQPQQALNALGKTEIGKIDIKTIEERNLLRARALSQLNQPDAAISTLNSINSKNAQRLRADILWREQKWEAAAAAIESLLPDVGAPLNDEDAQLVVNAAVALKLAGNTSKLKEMKTKYAAAISTTKLSSTFGVVTRDGGASDLSDHDSMMKIAGEVDMFKGFLDNYKAVAGKGS